MRSASCARSENKRSTEKDGHRRKGRNWTTVLHRRSLIRSNKRPDPMQSLLGLVATSAPTAVVRALGRASHLLRWQAAGAGAAGGGAGFGAALGCIMTPIGSLGFLAAGLPASIDAPLPVSDWEAGAAEEEEAPLEDPLQPIHCCCWHVSSALKP